MIILGINAYHGDASAALLRDGTLLAAVEEERFRRIKHCAGFPRESIRSCLQMTGVLPKEIDRFALSRNPRANLPQKILFLLRQGPGLRLLRDRARHTGILSEIPRRLAEELDLGVEEIRKKIHWVEHHPAHLSSSFFVSPFEEAAVCSIDGFGDFASTSFAVGRGSRLEPLQKVYFPHSLGMFYLAMTQYLGFPKYGDEYKVMGLSAYGQPEYAQALRRLIQWEPGGAFQMDLSYFRHSSESLSMTWTDGEPLIGPVFSQKLERLLGPARKPEEPIRPRHEAIAASLQLTFEEAVLHLLKDLHRKTRLPRLCLAGGCAMNSVMNGKIRRETPFQELYVQPAAADNGTSLGAAYHVWNQQLGNPRRFTMEHAYWGPAFSQAQCEEELRMRSEELKRCGCRATTLEDEAALCRHAAQRLADGKIIGWFQGKMEWGARALGNRSILADPRRPEMRGILNQKIKFREKFRPFAPSILEEAFPDYFEGAVLDPFMIQVYPVRPDKRSVIPAVTHVDGTGRLHTVSRRHNPLYWQLLKEFERLTGVPVLLNTSFNENEPIVHRPEEALDCFLRTEMDLLVLGNRVIEKGRSPQ
ncbi:MAG: carbamoyltransferase [Candidatus Omnitrophica bacterium]|nr:carbamoyltransferase [Candidatus Omnitrophota bacterium]